MKKITFKEYMESKERLLKAIDESPIHTISYSVKKYCRIPVGETKEDKQYIVLKPKQKVLIEWKYDSYITPQILSIQFENVEEVDDQQNFDAFWTTLRLQKWLSINTKEEIPELF